MTQPALAPSAGSPGCEEQLADLGLKLVYLQEAVRAGEEVRRQTTRNDPRNAPGMVDYFRRIRVLREQLIANEGWKRGEINQLPLIVNPGKTMAIGVLLGDYRTGWVGPYHPRSKRPLGDGKLRLVSQNQQLAMIPRPADPGEFALEDEDLANMQTWFFVTYRHVLSGVTRVSSELSLPEYANVRNYVERWTRRIPLPDLDFEGVIPYIEGTDDGPGEYDVEVGEKSWAFQQDHF